MSSNNWYKLVNSKYPLNQGDIFYNCPIVIPSVSIDTNSANNIINSRVDIYNVVILSQSCDLENNKIDIVLVSPFSSMSDFCASDPSFNSNKKKEKLRQGDYHSYHLLDKPNRKGYLNDYYIVDFHSVFGINIDYLRQLTKIQKHRLSLIPPYREHLSQSFARYMMRVGLPSSIPNFI